MKMRTSAWGRMSADERPTKAYVGGVQNILLRRIAVLWALATALVGCGAPHVTSAPAPAGLPGYKAVFIHHVVFRDEEPNAATNELLQQRLHEWESQSRQQLQDTLRERGYAVLDEKPADAHAILVLACDVDVQYGNRALRWAVGFGAGKGSVRSTLVASNGWNGAELFRASVASDLDMSVTGGDMSKVVRENIAKAAAQLPNAG